jgi:hypothetical protein
MVRFAASLVFGIVAGCATASSQSAAPLPREVDAGRREAAAMCPGRATFEAGYVQTADFNGDGRPDYLINEEKVKCPGSPPLFCGSGGCSSRLLLSTPNGYQTMFDGLSGTPTIDRSTQPPTLIIPTRHGTGRYRWNGREMAELRGR